MNKKIFLLCQKLYTLFQLFLQHIFGKDIAKTFDAMLRFKRKLNLKHPETLADKVSYISLHCMPELAAKCSDKWAARSYVAGKGLENILVPAYGGVFSSETQIDFGKLPNKFVLKATHGCRMNYVCEDKATMDMSACRKLMHRWLKTTYGIGSVEPQYIKLQHRIYCEQYLETVGGLIDYKIFCYNGEPSFIMTCDERVSKEGESSSVHINLFNLEWEPIDGIRNFKRHCAGGKIIPRPERLEEMLNIARKLSADFVFVRVDLYEVKKKVFFGELTFTPACGVFPSYSAQFIKTEGNKLTL